MASEIAHERQSREWKVLQVYGRLEAEVDAATGVRAKTGAACMRWHGSECIFLFFSP